MVFAGIIKPQYIRTFSHIACMFKKALQPDQFAVSISKTSITDNLKEKHQRTSEKKYKAKVQFFC